MSQVFCFAQRLAFLHVFAARKNCLHDVYAPYRKAEGDSCLEEYIRRWGKMLWYRVIVANLHHSGLKNKNNTDMKFIISMLQAVKGRGFDSGWSHWICFFSFLNPSSRNVLTSFWLKGEKIKLRGRSPLSNYTDRRLLTKLVPTSVDRGVAWWARRIPTAVFSDL
jgi:hypothetical protein